MKMVKLAKKDVERLEVELAADASVRVGGALLGDEYLVFLRGGQGLGAQEADQDGAQAVAEVFEARALVGVGDDQDDDAEELAVGVFDDPRADDDVGFVR